MIMNKMVKTTTKIFNSSHPIKSSYKKEKDYQLLMRRLLSAQIKEKRNMVNMISNIIIIIILFKLFEKRNIKQTKICLALLLKQTIISVNLR